MDRQNGRRRIDWLDAERATREFQRLCAREDLIEDFLGAVEQEMERQGMTRTDLARQLGCTPAHVVRIFRRTRALNASTIADIAFHLGLRLSLQLEPRKPTRPPVETADRCGDMGRAGRGG